MDNERWFIKKRGNKYFLYMRRKNKKAKRGNGFYSKIRAAEAKNRMLSLDAQLKIALNNAIEKLKANPELLKNLHSVKQNGG